MIPISSHSNNSIPNVQNLGAPDQSPDSQPPSKEERAKEIIKQVMIPAEGLKHTSKAFGSTVGIISCIQKITGALKTALIVAKLPLIFLSCCSSSLSAFDIHKNRKFLKILNTSLDECRRNASPEAKALAMKASLEKIDDEGTDSLSKMLNFSKDGKKALKKKIETLRTNILSKTVSEDDEQLLRTLTGRVHTNICYDIIDAACNCAAIVAGIITLTPVPVAAQLVSAVLFTVCAVETLVLWTIKNVFTNQNPFSSTSKSPVMKAIDIVSTSIRSIPRRIHEVFDHIHAHHVPVHVAA